MYSRLQGNMNEIRNSSTFTLFVIDTYIYINAWGLSQPRRIILDTPCCENLKSASQLVNQTDSQPVNQSVTQRVINAHY